MSNGQPGSPSKSTTLAGSLVIALFVSDEDTRAMVKFDRLVCEAGSLEALDPNLFTEDEMERLDRLNDLGMLGA